MTQCTPAQARELANEYYPNEGIAVALRALADHVEALTTENASILRASLYSADLATQAMEYVKTLTTERDALLQANLTHITEFGELQGWALSHPKSNLADSGVIATPVDHVNAAVEMVAGAHPDKGTSALAAPVVPAPAACAETLIFEDYPEFHAEGMGCGLEDRNITNRYEAMRYGWDEALEAVGLNITGFLSDLPQTAPVAQLSEPPDPLQGAANWLLKALKDCTTADLQRNLLIGYNRAHRLLFAAQEAAAPTTPKDSE